jgi:urease subunit alpha
VRDCRQVTKRDMKLNDALPAIPRRRRILRRTADGEILRSSPAKVLPLAQRYFLF